MAQQVLDDRVAERRQADRVGHDVGRLVGGRAPGPPPGGPVQRRHAGHPGPQVDRCGAVRGRAPRRVGVRARPGSAHRARRHRHHERPRAAPPRHPPLGEQLVVGRGRHRPAHAEVGRQRPGRRQPVPDPHRARPRRRPQRVGELNGERHAARPGPATSGGRSTSGLFKSTRNGPRRMPLTAHADEVTTATSPTAPLSPTARSTVRRGAGRARTDRAELYAVLDAGLVCHLGIVLGDAPVVLPTAYGRDRRHALPARIHRRRHPARGRGRAHRSA